MTAGFPGGNQFFGSGAWAAFDRDMRYLAASPEWLADYQLNEPVIGRSHYEVFPNIDEKWKDAYRRGLSGTTEGHRFERFHRADGSAQWIAWKIRPWRTKSGAIGGIVIISENVDPPVEAQKASSEFEILRATITKRSSRVSAVSPVNGSAKASRLWSPRAGGPREAATTFCRPSKAAAPRVGMEYPD